MYLGVGVIVELLILAFAMNPSKVVVVPSSAGAFWFLIGLLEALIIVIVVLLPMNHLFSIE